MNALLALILQKVEALDVVEEAQVGAVAGLSLPATLPPMAAEFFGSMLGQWEPHTTPGQKVRLSRGESLLQQSSFVM